MTPKPPQRVSAGQRVGVWGWRWGTEGGRGGVFLLIYGASCFWQQPAKSRHGRSLGYQSTVKAGPHPKQACDVVADTHMQLTFYFIVFFPPKGGLEVWKKLFFCRNFRELGRCRAERRPQQTHGKKGEGEKYVRHRLSINPSFPPTQRTNFTRDASPKICFAWKTVLARKGLTVESCVSSSLFYAFYKNVSIRQSYSGFRQFSL